MNPELKNHIAHLSTGVAHRGLHDLARPENSRAAFEHAIEANIPFEFDVHLCKDGHIVVCHDSSLLRMTGKEGIIEEMTLVEIQAHHYFDGSSPITLPELLAINNGKVPMVIELKTRNGNAKELAEAAVPLINAIPNKDLCYLISFDADALREAKRCGVSLPCGFLVGTEAVKHAKKELLYEFDFLDVEVHYSLLPRFRRYRKDGGMLFCWTVKNRLTHHIGKRRCHVLTWEEVDSAKEPLKVNAFVRDRLNPFHTDR